MAFSGARRSRRGVLGFASAAVIAAVLYTPARAEPAQPVTIAAGPLDASLVALAAQTHQQLLYTADLVQGRHAPALDGQFTTEQALERLLQGDDIIVTRAGPNVLVLKARPASRGPAAPAAAEGSGGRPPRPFGGEAPGRASAPSVVATGPGRAAPPEAATVSEVQVTGSHIRGVKDGPSPVLVIDRTEFQRSGFQTVAEALQALPQNFSGAATETTIALATDRSTGNSFYASGVNLRGLGANATLTLLNGRRMAGTGVSADFADLSTLPSIAVERVEVLLDGASAIYGSDAVGGVVNVLMRRRYDGAETRISGGAATQGSPSEFQFSQLLGKTWDGGGVVFAYEHNRRGDLPIDQRDYTASADLRPFGGTDHRFTFAHPGNIVGVNPATGISGAFWAIPTGQNGVGLQPSQLKPRTANLEEPLENSDILPRQVRDSLYASVSQDVTDGLELTADANYGRRRFGLETGSLVSSLTVSTANPFFVSPIGATTHQIQYSFAEDLPAPQLKGSAETFVGTVGANLRLPGDWRLSAYGAWAQDHSRTAQTGLLNSLFLSEALGNAPDRPETVYSAARDGYFNPFGDGSVNGAAVTRFIGSGYNTTDTRDRVTTGDAKLDGTLFELPAGPLRVALGGTLRHEDYRRSSVNFTSTLAPVPGTLTHNQRDVAAAYAELRAPLAGADSPIGALELSLAGRLEHYSDFGTTTKPKLGVIWTPVADLRLRASYGESFRAPSLPQLFGQQLYGPGSLPKGAARVTSILLQGGNPDLTPETATSWSVGFDYAPQALPGLRLSATWFDTDFTNRIDQPVRTVLTTALTDPTVASFVRLVSPATDPADRALVQSLISSPLYNTGLGLFPVEAYGAVVDERYVNTGRLHVTGVDLQGAYAFAAGDTQIQFAANGSYLYRYDQSLTPTAVILNRLGLANFPVRLRGRATVNAARGPFSGQVALNYVDNYHGPTGAAVRSQLTVDLQLRAEAPKDSRLAGVTAALTVRNLFDKDPPFYDAPGGFGYDPANGDPIGRFVTLQLTKVW